MDNNKLKKLTEINYVVPPSCGLCRFARFSITNLWGDCSRHTYQHLKHTGPARNMSVSRFGVCDKFEPDDRALAQLGKYGKFFKAG